jgi:hypothetical protein
MKMTLKQLEQVLYHDPFQPFRVLLKNGEEVIVKKPHKASVSGDQVAVVGQTKFPNGRLREGLRFIPLELVVSATHVEPDSVS